MFARDPLVRNRNRFHRCYLLIGTDRDLKLLNHNSYIFYTNFHVLVKINIYYSGQVLRRTCFPPIHGINNLS